MPGGCCLRGHMQVLCFKFLHIFACLGMNGLLLAQCLHHNARLFHAHDACSWVVQVDCIAYIKRSQLALLEYVMKGCSREVRLLSAGRT